MSSSSLEECRWWVLTWGSTKGGLDKLCCFSSTKPQGLPRQELPQGIPAQHQGSALLWNMFMEMLSTLP